MLHALRLQLAAKFLGWGKHLDQVSAGPGAKCEPRSVLVFFHGYSLAHTLRPLVVARALCARGYHVELAGRGPHAVRVCQEGFIVHEVETMPQSRMDQYVAQGDYAYYDEAWIERCVRSERALLQVLQPDLVIHDMKPTVSLAARLEGIDQAEVIQAYNQPGYPEAIPLLECFSTEAGSFEEFLEQRGEEVQHQRSFYLMADVPEFHPPGPGAPGYHYVGPLLDRPQESQHLPVLDEGWDLSLPLIYLTCGSSGRSPEYLDGLIEAFRDQPYRLLVTTAGRWAGAVAADNIRVVEFLPGEWVLRRARVLVGVVGVGAIYQALSCGVPIIGAPEHLDQEYHLNRVEALGLGLKLNRRDFEGGHVLHALEQILEDYAACARRCAPFVRHLEKWQGGEQVADLVDRHFSSSQSAYRADRPYLEEEGEFVHYLDTTTPDMLARESLRHMLRKGVGRGVPHQRREQRLFFDRLDSWNWLYDREPGFFAPDYWALEKKRQRFFVQEGRHMRSRTAWQSYRVTYRYRIFPEELRPGQRVKVFLPYPVPAECQRGVRLLSCTPAGMEECLAPSLGFFYGYTFKVGDTAGGGIRPWDFTYVCELKVGEQVADEGAPSRGLGTLEQQRFLALESGFLEEPEIVRFRRQLEAKRKAPAPVRARAIYEALVQNRHFRKTKDWTQGLTYSAVSALDGSGGHCITLSRAFVALCRAEGIPARERSGALIGYPVGERTYAMKAYREPVFGHTWAEVFLEGKGWAPVEFHGIVIGKGAMTTDNVIEAELRTCILENSARYLDYYFGRLDNQHLVCSNSVKRIPPCLIERPEWSVWDDRRWHAPADLRFECHLQVECL